MGLQNRKMKFGKNQKNINKIMTSVNNEVLILAYNCTKSKMLIIIVTECRTDGNSLF